MSVLDDATSRARAIAASAALLLVLAIAFVARPAFGASGEPIGGPSLPHVKADGQSLTYDTFTGSSCSQAGFTTSTVAHLDIAGQVQVDGQTFLNGVPYDTYAYIDNGPDTYVTDFLRPRPTDPPFGASSSTYTFVFQSRVRRDATFLGQSITTITCANGVFSAVNQWVSNAQPIPAGEPAGWAALALLLAALAAKRLAARRA